MSKIPSHLAYVATLPCETLLPTKQAINDNYKIRSRLHQTNEQFTEDRFYTQNISVQNCAVFGQHVLDRLTILNNCTHSAIASRDFCGNAVLRPLAC